MVIWARLLVFTGCLKEEMATAHVSSPTPLPISASIAGAASSNHTPANCIDRSLFKSEGVSTPNNHATHNPGNSKYLPPSLTINLLLMDASNVPGLGSKKLCNVVLSKLDHVSLIIAHGIGL